MIGNENKIVIQGLEYILPKPPPQRTMRNYGLPRVRQVWSRRTEYEQWDWDASTEEWTTEQIEWYFEEISRIYDGEWIFIGGEPTYINGMFYFFLQWNLLENEYYPEYRDTSLEYFRFCEIAEADPLCLGTILIKGRRLGASSMEASIMVRNLLIERNKRNGIISKTGDDAKDIFGFAVSAFQSLPVFLKPSIEGNDAPKKILSVKKQANRVTKGSKTSGEREGLNNELSWKSTAMNSYDSGRLLRILVDESSKWLEVNIGEYWKIVQKCLTKGAMVVGKASFVSTVNRGDKGGDNFKSLWYDSDPDKRNSLNQTSSRLIRIFIPATRGYEGYIDRYGNSVVDTPTPEQTEYLKEAGCPNPYIGSKEFLEMQRDLVKHDPDLLAEEIRTAPFTWEEVFSTTSTVSHFHNIEEHKEREAELMEKLSELGRDVRKGELGRRGWFKKTPNGLVKFVDDPVGLWYIDRLLPEEESNKFEYKMKVNSKGESTLSRVPTNCEFGGAGWDTFSHGGSTAEKGSDACCIIRSRYSSIDPDNTGYPVAMFLGRMTRKGDVHEQLFNGLQYYGVKMLGELAPSDWRDYAEDNGYEEYCIVTQRKSDGKVVRGINAQDKEAREQHLTLQVESALSDVNKIPFIRLIRDRIAFDINNRGDYDSAMADGYSLMALKEVIKKKKVKRTERVFFQKGTITSY